MIFGYLSFGGRPGFGVARLGEFLAADGKSKNNTDYTD
jgi:hypothetical protein